jgi:beta-glucosidase
MLPKVQTDLLKALKATGKPVVFVMMTGSAVATPWEADNLPAIVNAWYGGQAAGTALADVLFGDYNPAGRLPVTFYRSDSDLPSFEDYTMKNRTYRYFNGKPLYGFGYGLSYSSFKYSGLQAPATVQKGKAINISAKVQNAGKLDGEEVTQLYITHNGLKIPVPLKALKGFKRSMIKAGAIQNITFTIQPQDLLVTAQNGEQKYMTGQITISVGGSQADKVTAAAQKTISKTITLL